MKSKDICQEAFEAEEKEEKESSKVLREKGNRKSNGKRILRSNSGGDQRLAASPSFEGENSNDDSKLVSNSEDSSEDGDRKFSQRNGTNGESSENAKADNNDPGEICVNETCGNAESVCGAIKPEKTSSKGSRASQEESIEMVGLNGSHEGSPSEAVQSEGMEKVDSEEKNIILSDQTTKKEESIGIETVETIDSKSVDQLKNRTEKGSVETVIDLADEPSPKKINLKLCFDGERYSLGQDSDAENVEAVEDMALDADGNKENDEKFSKMADVETLSMTVDEEESSDFSGCEIQVEKCQTILDSEKELIWTEGDRKKFTRTSSEADHDEEKNDEAQEPKNSSFLDSPRKPSAAEEKQQEREEEDDVTVISKEKEVDGREPEENNDGEVMEFEVEEIDHSVSEMNREKMGREETDAYRIGFKMAQDNVGESEKNRTDKEEEADSKNVRRRKKNDGVGHGTSAKKKKLKESDDDDAEGVELELNAYQEKNGHDSSPCENPTEIRDAITTLPSPEAVEEKKCQASNESNNKPKSTPGQSKMEESNGNGQERRTFLANLRGTLKNLTRSDLEELIVHKLCEVITERSNVGELRRKAQALEEDQEKWKSKVQALTKQVREMEMVMKKYVNEVQKQIKEGANQVVVPLRVTRSVGLQVSFFSSPNKAPKPNSSQNSVPSTPGKSANSRNSKTVVPSKLQPQLSILSQNVVPKSKLSPCPKSLPIPSRIPFQNSKKQCISRPEFGSPAQTSPQTVLNRPVPNLAPRSNFKFVPMMPSPQQQQHPPVQNGSKVIDLTEDDDRQSAIVVKSPGPVRVVNHAPLSQTPQNNKFTYLIPTTNSGRTATSNGPNRQVLVAAPTMPPLLFKGGNVPQPQSAQPQMLNQSNRLIFPKPLKHPAPLPQQPVSPYQKPNMKLIPPRPALKISKVQTGIVLSWNMSLGPEHAPISSYQLYAYQEGISPPATSLWKKVGDVKALPLPMACTLTQFMSGHKYHFAVRAVDLHSRIGPFSFPGTIVLVK